MDVKIAEILTSLTSSGFRDIAGSRASARIPISRSFANRLVAQALQGVSSPVRDVDLRPHAPDLDAQHLDAACELVEPGGFPRLRLQQRLAFHHLSRMLHQNPESIDSLGIQQHNFAVARFLFLKESFIAG